MSDTITIPKFRPLIRTAEETLRLTIDYPGVFTFERYRGGFLTIAIDDGSIQCDIPAFQPRANVDLDVPGEPVNPEEVEHE